MVRNASCSDHRKDWGCIVPGKETLDTAKEFTCVHIKTLCVTEESCPFMLFKLYYKMEVLKALVCIHNLGQIPPWKNKHRLKTKPIQLFDFTVLTLKVAK